MCSNILISNQRQLVWGRFVRLMFVLLFCVLEMFSLLGGGGAKPDVIFEMLYVDVYISLSPSACARFQQKPRHLEIAIGGSNVQGGRAATTEVVKVPQIPHLSIQAMIAHPPPARHIL